VNAREKAVAKLENRSGNLRLAIPLRSPPRTAMFIKGSSGFEFGEMIAIKKFILFNVVTRARREMSGRYLDRRITDDSLRQGAFLYI
jgi:hypothetical protein